jgi:ankyrin repeat protein
MLQSPETLWNTELMEDIVEEGDIETVMDDSEASTVKCERLVALVRKTEETEVSDYMGTMLDVNTLVYELVNSDQSRSQLSFKHSSTPIPACYVCRALTEIGTIEMANKVESERILLEAIAVCEGCFGENHFAANHYRVNLFLLYENWICRTSSARKLLLRIMPLALRAFPAAKASDFMAELLQEDLTDDGKCMWLQGSSLGPFASTSSRQFSALSIRDDATRESPRSIWAIIPAVIARLGGIGDDDLPDFEPMFEMILNNGPSSVDGSSYFWIAIFISVTYDMWGALYNLKGLISNIKSEIFPGSTAIKLSLKGLVYSNGEYRLEQQAVTVGSDESGLEKGGSSSLDRHQSKFDDLSNLKGSLQNLKELRLVLAGISLEQLAKSEGSKVLPNAEYIQSWIIYNLLRDAAELGNYTLIPQLEAQFGNLIFQGDNATFLGLLDGDDPVSSSGVDQPLDIAIRHGHYLTVEALLDAGADPDGGGNYDLFPVVLAAKSGYGDIVRLLIKKGAGGSDPFSRVHVLRRLTRLGKSNYQWWFTHASEYDNVFSLLFYIGLFGDLEEYEFLDVVSERAREQLISLRDKTPRSGEPFLRSVLTEMERCELQGFLEERDFLGEEDSTGRGLELILDVLTGVHVEQQARKILRIALFGSTEAMNEILDPPKISESESPVLHILVSINAPNALGVFLELGPNLAILDTKRNSALHVAAARNRTTCTRQLLEFGIDVHTENKDGKTAYQIALENGYKGIGEETALRGFILDPLSPIA